MKKTLITCSLLALSSLMTGCASIMGSDTQNMPIASTPSDASIKIVDEKGAEIFKGQTPTTVSLSKSDGTYFGKKSYNVTISKDGYQSQVIPLTASANGWYIGNIVFGGFIGWLVVDPFNGKMYNLSPEKIDASLDQAAKTSHNNSSKDGITVMLLQDVPLAYRDQLQAIN